jgi:hypothetical protein
VRFLGEFNIGVSPKQREQPSLVREQGLTINSVIDVYLYIEDFTHLDIAGAGSQLSASYLGSICNVFG